MTLKENNIFYNQEIKEQYLNEFENPLLKVFASIPLKKARRTEKIYEKDVYDMTVEELEGVVGDLACSTANAAYNNIIAIEKYIDWSIREGYRKSNINPLRNIDKVKWSEQFVANYKNNYFTREQIEEMASELVNSSDKAVLLGLFEGIKGKGFAELLNLVEKDIREKNDVWQARLTNKDGSVRVIEISEMLAMSLINSANTPKYINKNGESDKRRESPLEDSPHVFKKARRGKSNDELLDHNFVTRKFTLFKDVFGMRFLKSKHVSDSGIMHMANELSEDGFITLDNIRVIADQFDTPYTYTDDKQYRNVTVIKRIIDIPEFEEMYGYKMQYK
ncbi:hypothetical protein ABE073_04460 [Lederbergia citrisecunda]|uniref:phage lytic cycle repressor MrpR family protein n=1 Tax=Lederbergia citrisecunda TaxID=2833583 RepID=UPI003D270B85